MRVVVEGLAGGVVEYSGESTTFTLSGGQRYNAGEILMNYIGDKLIWNIGNWDEKNWW
jgi:hypothetical protein